MCVIMGFKKCLEDFLKKVVFDLNFNKRIGGSLLKMWVIWMELVVLFRKR